MVASDKLLLFCLTMGKTLFPVTISLCLSCNGRRFEGSHAAPVHRGQPGRTDRIGRRPDLWSVVSAVRRGLC